MLLESQKNLVDALIKTVQLAVSEGHLARHTDPRQLVYELEGIIMVMNVYLRLFKDRRAVERARTAFKRLIDASRP